MSASRKKPAKARRTSSAAAAVRERHQANHHARELLEERDRFFEELASETDSVFWVMDAVHEKLVYVSPAFERIWGVPVARLRKDGRLWMKMVHPEDRHIVERAFKIQRKAGRSEEQYRIVRPDGKLRWVRNRAFGVRDSKGRIVRLVGVNEDITERKKALDALATSEERYRLLAEHTDDFVALSDVSGNVLYLSPSYERRLGVTLPEVNGRKGAERIHPGDKPIIRKARAANLAGKPTSIEYRFLGKDDRWIWLEGHCSPILDANGRVARLLLVSRDITERKKAVDALAASEARFRMIAESADDFIVIGDTRGNRHYISPSYYRVTGWTPEEVAVTDWRSRLHPDDAPVVEKAWSAVQRGRTVTVEHRLRCKDGRWIWMELRCKPMPDKTLLLWMRDITTRKEIEAALARNESQLVQAQSMASLGSFEIDLTTDLRRWSAEMYRIWRRDPAKGPFSREEFLRAIHPEDRARILGAVVLLSERGVAIDQQFRGVFPGGEVRYFHGRGEVAAKDAKGRPVRIILTTQDITSQTKAEAALRESEGLLAMAQSVARMGSFDMNLQTGERRWSREMYQIWRRDPDSGPTPSDQVVKIVHPDDRDRFAAAMRATVRGGLDFDEQLRLVFPKGVVRYIHSRGEVIRDSKNRPLRLVGICQDITDRKIAQLALEESQKRLATIFEKVADCIYLVEVGRRGEFRFQSVNEAFLRITGFREEQIIGRPMEEWFPPESLSLVQAKYRQAIATRRTVEWEETTLHPAGVRVGRIAVVPVFDSNGRCRQLIGTAHDITDRRRLEEAMLRAADGEKTRIGRDLHDGLGQEMTAIGLLNDALLESLKSQKHPAAATAEKLSQMIRRASLVVRRVGRGLQPVAPDPGGLAAGLRLLMSETGAVKGEFQCPSPVMVADAEAANHLYRIAQEAVQNALRHARAKRIIVRLLLKHGRIILEIEDDGRGMSKKSASAGGVGLRTMNYRAECISGVIEFLKPSKRGTLVRCSVPAVSGAVSSVGNNLSHEQAVRARKKNH